MYTYITCDTWFLKIESSTKLLGENALRATQCNVFHAVQWNGIQLRHPWCQMFSEEIYLIPHYIWLTLLRSFVRENIKYWESVWPCRDWPLIGGPSGLWALCRGGKCQAHEVDLGGTPYGGVQRSYHNASDVNRLTNATETYIMLCGQAQPPLVGELTFHHQLPRFVVNRLAFYVLKNNASLILASWKIVRFANPYVGQKPYCLI